VLLMPIYLSVGGNGSHTSYVLAGLAPFVLTGYFLSGFKATSTLTGNHLCSESSRCLYGYFVRAYRLGCDRWPGFRRVNRQAERIAQLWRAGADSCVCPE
jgi:hypothetical protein